jgi:hypothetical protein
MEFLPFPVLRPRAYTPEQRQELSAEHKEEKLLYFEQSLTFVYVVFRHDSHQHTELIFNI